MVCANTLRGPEAGCELGSQAHAQVCRRGCQVCNDFLGGISPSALAHGSCRGRGPRAPVTLP